jgi:hypothetical protein
LRILYSLYPINLKQIFHQRYPVCLHLLLLLLLYLIQPSHQRYSRSYLLHLLLVIKPTWSKLKPGLYLVLHLKQDLKELHPVLLLLDLHLLQLRYLHDEVHHTPG